jgi:hypothetical protein
MIQRKILARAVTVGVVVELALVFLAHFKPAARGMLLFGAMMIAGMAGLLYARDLARGYGLGALGGGAAGAASGVAAVGLATFLHDQPELYLPYGVMVCTLTGIVGGLFGQMDARIRAWRASLKR